MDNSSLMLVAKKFLGHISLSFLGAHVLKEFGIARDLLDCIKKRYINLDLIKNLTYFIHLYTLFLSLFG